MSRLPIRVRLTLAFALVMAVVLACLGAFLYVRLASSLTEQIGDELETRGATLASSKVDPSLFTGEEGVARKIGSDVSGQVTLATPTFRVVLITAAELAQARRGSVIDVERDGFRLRAMSVDGSVIVVGKSLEDRDEALDALLAQLLIALPLALLVSSAIGYWVAAAALRPVDAMRRQAGEISAETPDRRLPLPRAHDEVFRLGTTLNEMLDRLDAGLQRERRFVADAGHELRTPLAALETELELALRQPRTAEELENALRSAAEETDRLVRLAEDLLLVARSEGGRLPMRPSRVRVDDLFADVATRFERRAGDAGRLVQPAVRSDLELTVDPVRIGQALGNLVDNALRYGEGTIRLEARERGDVVELHVLDEGEGFPPGFLAAAFERFSRSDEARGRGGAGLGLAIVQAIAEAHDGTAHAVNLDGSGADVWLALPRS